MHLFLWNKVSSIALLVTLKDKAGQGNDLLLCTDLLVFQEVPFSMGLASMAVTMLSAVTSAWVLCYAANMFVFHPCFVKVGNSLFDIQGVLPLLQNSNLNCQLGKDQKYSY
jgi:hypothetical protein